MLNASIKQKSSSLLLCLLGCGLLLSLYTAFHTLWKFDSDVELEDGTLLFPMSETYSGSMGSLTKSIENAKFDVKSGKDSIISKAIPATTAQPITKTPSTSEAIPLQCVPIASDGNPYPLSPSLRGQTTQGINHGPSIGIQDDNYCDCIGGTSQAPQISIQHSKALNAVSPKSKLRGDWIQKASSLTPLASMTDEPNTPACSMPLAGRPIYRCIPTKNTILSSNPTQTLQILDIFASRIHDSVCDCCDGSDEVDGPYAKLCPNTCHGSTNDVPHILTNGPTTEVPLIDMKSEAQHQMGRLGRLSRPRRGEY